MQAFLLLFLHLSFIIPSTFSAKYLLFFNTLYLLPNQKYHSAAVQQKKQ